MLRLLEKLTYGEIHAQDGKLFACSDRGEQPVTLHLVKKGLAIDVKGPSHFLTMPLVLIQGRQNEKLLVFCQHDI